MEKSAIMEPMLTLIPPEEIATDMPQLMNMEVQLCIMMFHMVEAEKKFLVKIQFTISRNANIIAALWLITFTRVFFAAHTVQRCLAHVCSAPFAEGGVSVRSMSAEAMTRMMASSETFFPSNSPTVFPS